MPTLLAGPRPVVQTSWGYFGPGFLEVAGTLTTSEGSGTGSITWVGAAHGTNTPPVPSGNRMGGTGAIRKPPR
jgi:hypothetical protein